MVAIRAARTFTGKHKVIKVGGAYHGWSDQMVYGLHIPGTGAMEAFGIPGGALKETQEFFPNDLAALRKLLEKNDAEATAGIELEAKGEPERQARTEAKAKAEFYARIRAEIEKKLRAQTQAKFEAEKRLEAEIQARRRAEQQVKAEAQERAKAEARVRVQAKVIANVQAQMEELAMMFRTEAQKKTRAYTDIFTKIEAEQEAKAELEEKVRAYEKLLAKNDTEVKDRAETKRQARTEDEANELKDKVIVGSGVKEMVYPQRLHWYQWLLRGIREDNITSVIVFCLLLCVVLSVSAISGYFVYTILCTFL